MLLSALIILLLGVVHTSFGQQDRYYNPYYRNVAGQRQYQYNPYRTPQRGDVTSGRVSSPVDQIRFTDQFDQPPAQEEGYDGTGQIGVRNSFLKKTSPAAQAKSEPDHSGSPHLLPPSPADLFGNIEFRQNLQEYKISRDVTEAINHFSAKVLNVVGAASVSDYVLSSFSLTSVMAMLLAGADGDTYQEIKQAFAFPENPNATYTGFQVLLGELKRSNSTLVSSNRLFIRDDFPILENFQWILKQKFASPAQQTNFSAPNSYQKINKVVAEDTKQKIQSLIEPGTFDDSTRLVALNTMYFKGTWMNQFMERATKSRDFYTLSGTTVKKDMMSTEDYFRVANIDFLNAKAVALPYESSSKIEMVILVPNDKDGLREVESKLASIDGAYDKIVQKLKGKAKNIVLMMPKFSMASKHDFENTLRVFGVTSAFSESKADFSKVAGEEYKLYLSNVIQKAFLSVNEAGSEAGAATFGALFTPLSIGPSIEDTVIADRPFLGFIRDPSTNLILFQYRKAE